MCSLSYITLCLIIALIFSDFPTEAQILKVLKAGACSVGKDDIFKVANWLSQQTDGNTYLDYFHLEPVRTYLGQSLVKF